METPRLALLEKPDCARRASEFADSLEREITQRTWGRVHRLRVEILGDRLQVCGYTPTYYVKQLAIQAVLEKQQSFGLPPVDIDFQVGAGEKLVP